MAIRGQSESLIPVSCRCGRSLRAKVDQVGTEITCWDCHQAVMVTMPRARMNIGRTFSIAFSSVLQDQRLVRILGFSAIVALAMSVPGIGLTLAGILLIPAAGTYGMALGRVGESGDGVGWRAWLTPFAPVQAACCVLLVAGTFLPLWTLHLGPKSSPHLGRSGSLAMLAAWAFAPIAMLVAFGGGPGIWLGSFRTARLMARFPAATLAAIAIVPLTFVAVEVGMASFFALTGNLPFFALEFLPIPGEPIFVDDIPYYGSIDFRSLPASQFAEVYLRSIRQGYSFVGAIPPSLSMPSRAGLSPSALYVTPAIYAGVRFVLTWAILAVLLVAFAIQALWLGSIPALERKRPA